MAVTLHRWVIKWRIKEFDSDSNFSSDFGSNGLGLSCIFILTNFLFETLQKHFLLKNNRMYRMYNV